ncbi:MAG TPA: hypothetical protein VM802_13375 [Chitinophaga sp.]|uniref:hypothetical protein n=1 Tax=Chitinophaga sp. TaxID=1869181 RepID=UPI002BA95F98|nr:hypothetical protein [Chitinophaga sp.]HVI45859.1 hypothetical protein [Chitinophaga sp.]
MTLYLKSIIVLLFICSINIQVNAKNFTDTTGVFVIAKDDMLPDGARKIGKVKVTDGGFKTNCSYDSTIVQAKAKAIKAGGNVIKITELLAPDGLSTCYRLYGEIYRHPDIPGLEARRSQALDSAMKSMLSDTASYSLLCVYRPASALGTIISYNVKLEDSVICRVKNNSKFFIKIYKTGPARLSARTEGPDEVSIDFQPGKVYFLRCSIDIGAFVGHPKFNIVDRYVGLYELNAVGRIAPKEIRDPVY